MMFLTIKTSSIKKHLLKSITVALALLYLIVTPSYAATSSKIQWILNDQLIPIKPIYKNGEAFIDAKELVTFGAEVSEPYLGTIQLKSQHFILEVDAINQLGTYKGIRQGVSFNAGTAPLKAFIDHSKVYVPLKKMVSLLGYNLRQLDKTPRYRISNGAEKLSDIELNALFDSNFAKLPALRNAIMSSAPKKNAAPISGLKPKLVKPHKIVYLTFDDGPNGSTEAILDLLAKHDMKATFFMLNSGIIKNRALVDRMIEEGHAIGLHGVTHRVHLFYKTADSPLREMDQANNALEKTVGLRSRLIRTPYGSRPGLTQTQYSKLVESGYLLWDWNVDSMDSMKPYVDPAKIAKATISGMKSKAKPVVLFHDKKCTVEALESILKWMDENGYYSSAIESEMAPLNWR